MGQAQVDIFKSEGLDLSRVVIGHIDRNPDPFMLSILPSRVSIWNSIPPDVLNTMRVGYGGMFESSPEAGHADQIVLPGIAGAALT
jgi:hypothetical protein